MTTGSVIQFPPHRFAAVMVLKEGPAWLVLLRSHGWLFGCRHDALIEACALASASGMRVVECAS
ncbi:MAG: hypothetical protein GEU91_16085 [Rhizobiales bacterium]|nr:hypothetical protein [Hyphomicrobiales bacterium]